MNKKLKIVHFSDLHFGSGERYGSINPETGLNKRFEDFMSALDKPVDYAIENEVDLAIFTGDTYKHATPEPIYQKEFAKRIKLLSENNIPTILLVGNHDVLYRVDGSSSLDIYNALDIENVTVYSKITLDKIKTKNGEIQIISLPHVTKSKLLTKDDYRDKDAKEQDGLMNEKVKHALTGCIEALNSNLPAILIGHGTIESASFGSEQDLSIGKVLSYPKSFFQNKNLDYVGFGHIHKHQILQKEEPLILYAGSLERVDFGEEGEDKGFIYLEIEKGEKLKHEYISTNPRPFITIEVDLTETEEDLQKKLVEEVLKNKKPSSVVRVRYKIQEEDLEKINLKEIKESLKDTFSFVIQAEIVRKDRTYRMEELDSNLITNPLLALEKYLFDKDENEKQLLLSKAKELIEETNKE